MKAPYGVDIIEDCCQCTECESGRFCAFSQPTLESLSEASHKSVLPAGAFLFGEGQTPRGVFIVCSGKVNLSTTSREGKNPDSGDHRARGGAGPKRDALRRDL
jgi:CRP/FNR family cyclic AMP-dependent transcriptional regulator